jgi:hypothetical protein
MLATFTLGDALFTLVELAVLLVWTWVAIGVVFDVFRSHDLANWAKAVWTLAIVILPFFGVFAYLIARGHTMHEHRIEDARAQHDRLSILPRPKASGPVDDLSKLAELKAHGVIDEAEFQRAKFKVLE